MELSEVIRRRRMVRDFDIRPVPPDVVERLLAAAQRGPSSGFTQGFDFLVFEGPEQTRRFWEATAWGVESDDWQGARRAPLVIVPCAHEAAYVQRYLAPDKARVGRQSGADFPAPYWYIDTAFAGMLILLTAVDAGLGGFYFSLGPTRRAIPLFRAAVGIPETHDPIGAIAIGYPGAADRPLEATVIRERRRAPSGVVHRGGW